MVFHVCAALLSWLFRSDDPARRALQWWQQQQINRLHDKAELIREGVLQELFAIRRALELAHHNQEPVSQASLQQLESLHIKLEQVSNELSPAFIQDSLPLAIQHVLKQWQIQHPAVTLSPRLPAESPEPTLASRVALTTLEELLKFIAEPIESEPRQLEVSLEVELTHTNTTAMLVVRLGGLDRGQCQAIAHHQELSHLRQSFRWLTDGRFAQDKHASWIEWRLSWPTP